MRPSWDTYWLEQARSFATRSTCDRAHVGAVLVVDRRLVASGYNGAPAGEPHCDEAGHLMRGAERMLRALEDAGGSFGEVPRIAISALNHCVRTTHAEANALIQAGPAAKGATLYCTHSPCWECAKLIVNAGVARVVYSADYWASAEALEMLKRRCVVEKAP